MDFDGTKASRDMVDAVQVCIDFVEQAFVDRNQSNFFVEKKFNSPRVHPLFRGTADVVYYDKEALHILDYKHGVGVVVEAENNPQLMYYAAGVLDSLGGSPPKVVLHIAQPRGFHYDGPIRSWETTPEAIIAWQNDVLVPAMNKAMTSTETKTGEHCRFCPARSRNCPALMADIDELEDLMIELEGRTAAALSNEQIARLLALKETTAIALKAASSTALARMQTGAEIPGFALAPAKVNRVWKDEEKAEAEARKAFGDRAFSKPELKSPAQVEKLPLGATFVGKYALKPEAGLTIVKEGGKRKTVTKDMQSMFKPV